MGDVCLEEKLELDYAPDGAEFSPAMHYLDGEWVRALNPSPSTFKP